MSMNAFFFFFILDSTMPSLLCANANRGDIGATYMLSLLCTNAKRGYTLDVYVISLLCKPANQGTICTQVHPFFVCMQRRDAIH